MDKRRKRYLETRYKNFMASMVEEIKENKKKEAEFAAATCANFDRLFPRAARTAKAA